MIVKGNFQQASAGRVARAIGNTTVLNQNEITSMGNVQDLPGYNDNLIDGLTSFVVTFTNGGGAAVNYILGDPTGAIGTLFNPTTPPSQPTTTTFGTVAGMQQSFGFAPVFVHGINYSATSGATQFPSAVKYVTGDLNGMFGAKPIIISEAQRNTAFNANLLTLRFQQGYKLDWNGALVISVAAGQTVSWTVFVRAAENR
jgi:hypothetical protein